MHKRLLFVDDEPILREVYFSLGEALGNGHEVCTAASGPEALKLLTEKSFDVIISDLAMPQMDGMEFLNEVVRDYPESARIVVSGFADRLKVAECLTIGHRFFNKPLNFKALSALLKRICKYSYLVRDPRIRGPRRHRQNCRAGSRSQHQTPAHCQFGPVWHLTPDRDPDGSGPNPRARSAQSAHARRQGLQLLRRKSVHQSDLQGFVGTQP